MIIDEEMFEAIIDCYSDIVEKADSVVQIFGEEYGRLMYYTKCVVTKTSIQCTYFDDYGDEMFTMLPVRFLFMDDEDVRESLAKQMKDGISVSDIE